MKIGHFPGWDLRGFLTGDTIVTNELISDETRTFYCNFVLPRTLIYPTRHRPIAVLGS